MTKLTFSAEFTLTIQESGIVPKFLAWVKENESYDETNGWPYIGQLEERWMSYGPFDPQRTDVYQANDFLIGILKIPFNPESKDSILYVHVFQNVPMQVFAEKFPELLKALGVSTWENSVPWYLDKVKAGVEMLQKGKVAE